MATRVGGILADPLEQANEQYRVAKIAGIKLTQNYRQQYDFNPIGVMPTDFNGLGDNFDFASSHALGTMLRNMHEAKLRGEPEVVVWGTGTPMREFLHVDDLADAALFLMQNYDGAGFLNVGVGEDVSIRDLALLIRDVVGFGGELVFDTSKPDGTPRKLLDVSKLTALGWRATTSLSEGVRSTYRWFLEQESVRG